MEAYSACSEQLWREMMEPGSPEELQYRVYQVVEQMKETGALLECRQYEGDPRIVRVAAEGTNGVGKSAMMEDLVSSFPYYLGSALGNRNTDPFVRYDPNVSFVCEPPRLPIEPALRQALGLQEEVYRTAAKGAKLHPMQLLMLFMLSRNHQDYLECQAVHSGLPLPQILAKQADKNNFYLGCGSITEERFTRSNPNAEPLSLFVSDRNWMSSINYQGLMLASREWEANPSGEFIHTLTKWIRIVADLHIGLENSGYLLPTNMIVVMLPYEGEREIPEALVENNRTVDPNKKDLGREVDQYEQLVVKRNELWLYTTAIDVLRHSSFSGKVPQLVVLKNDPSGRLATVPEISLLVSCAIASLVMYGEPNPNGFQVPAFWQAEVARMQSCGSQLNVHPQRMYVPAEPVRRFTRTVGDLNCELVPRDVSGSNCPELFFEPKVWSDYGIFR